MALVAAADVDRWKSSARRFADGFTPGQKVVTVVAIIAAVVGGMVFMSLSGKPTYSPLFTNLQPSDAAAITAKLTSDKVPYQLENGGSTILVPQNEVDQERINMASAGLPASSTNVGLGILDKEGITTSQLTQQADYLRALQGELQQTIGAINGVTGVQVNLAMPANNTFALNNTSPTGASVLVDTAPGQTLSGGEVQAIVHLVASSVPNLSASEVTVADNNGNLLAGPGVDTSAGSNNNATSAFDTAQQAKIAAYLQSVLGPNNADIQVNAQLDFNKVSTTTNGFQLGANNTPVTVPTQTQTSTQTATGGATGAGANGGGVLGTTTAPAGTGTGNGNYTNSSSSTQYATGTVHQDGPGRRDPPVHRRPGQRQEHAQGREPRHAPAGRGGGGRARHGTRRHLGHERGAVLDGRPAGGKQGGGDRGGGPVQGEALLDGPHCGRRPGHPGRALPAVALRQKEPRSSPYAGGLAPAAGPARRAALARPRCHHAGAGGGPRTPSGPRAERRGEQLHRLPA